MTTKISQHVYFQNDDTFTSTLILIQIQFMKQIYLNFVFKVTKKSLLQVINHQNRKILFQNYL